jgi:hypothetical protein
MNLEDEPSHRRNQAMPKWMKPAEELPDVYAGDRVCIIVMERESAGKPIKPRLVTLEATEDGWDAIEDLYQGYTPHDGVLWSTEKDICGIVEALNFEPAT